MKTYKIAFLGFGNVGRSLANLLLKKRQELISHYNLTFSVTGISTKKHGCIIHPDGLDMDDLMDKIMVNPGLNINEATGLPAFTRTAEFIHQCGADVLFENTPVNYDTGEPAISHIKSALNSGMHVVTANKGPVVHAYHELSQIAKLKGLKFYFESTVMDGAPIFSLFRDSLPLINIRSIQGVLNSTTNLILNRIEMGESFDEAISYAQSIGIAETDPSGDIDGWDASVKIAELVTVLMGVQIKPQDVLRNGIRDLGIDEIRNAKKHGQRWKLICSAKREFDRVYVSVGPELVDADSPLFLIDGTTSIVVFESDVLGKLSIIEEDPGPDTTAYGCMADFINIIRNQEY